MDGVEFTGLDWILCIINGENATFIVMYYQLLISGLDLGVIGHWLQQLHLKI